VGARRHPADLPALEARDFVQATNAAIVRAGDLLFILKEDPS
jgi:hypothetical protein